MRKTFFWAATALALLPGVAQRANAQASAVADVAADAETTASEQSVPEAATGAADAANDSVSEAATDQSEASALTPATSPELSAEAAAAAGTTLNSGETAPRKATPETDINADVNVDANSDNAGANGRANLSGQTEPADIGAGLQFGAATQRGITLNSVANNSFLYRNGLRQGDELVSYGGRPIRSQADFNRWAIYQPGQRVPLVVWRDGREETVYITYDQQPTQRQAGYAPQAGTAYLGVTFDPHSNSGAFVRSVTPGSPAAQAGILPGQIIVAINDQRISHYQEVIDYVATLQPGEEVDVVAVHRLALGGRPGQATPVQQSTGVEPAALPQSPPLGVPAAAVPGAQVESRAIPRPGDADRDGRILDGDGRIGPRERAGR